MPTWLTKPETVLAIVLFALSVIISLLSKEIRTGFGTGVRTMKATKLQEAENELRFLEWINGNTYNLLLWAIRNCVNVFVYTFRLVFAMLFITFIASVWFKGVKVIEFAPSLTTILPGAFIGRAISMHDTLKALYSYDESTAGLKAKIERLKKDLQASAPAKL